MDKRVIALGLFDGVHRGHGALLQMARKRADGLQVKAAAMTFTPHPETVIAGKPLPLLNTLKDRQYLMTGVWAMDEALVLPFTEELMELPWEAFVKDLLIGQYGAVHVVCGHDYRFGYHGEGTAEKLKTLCETIGLGCDVIPAVEDGGIISSSRIRALVKEGRMEEANRLLGHPHVLTGKVTHGKQLGRHLGCPTANVVLPEELVEPAYGVYAARAILPDGTAYRAVTNVGKRPTVADSDTVTVESWLLDFAGDLYGQEIRLEFCAYLRPEQKFGSLEELVSAIHKDARATREYFL